jgi:hypothetical protein
MIDGVGRSSLAMTPLRPALTDDWIGAAGAIPGPLRRRRAQWDLEPPRTAGVAHEARLSLWRISSGGQTPGWTWGAPSVGSVLVAAMKASTEVSPHAHAW